MGGSGESCLVVTLMMYLSVSQIQTACVGKKKKKWLAVSVHSEQQQPITEFHILHLYKCLMLLCIYTALLHWWRMLKLFLSVIMSVSVWSGIRKKSKVPGVMITQFLEELPEGVSTPDFTRKPIALTIQEGKS